MLLLIEDVVEERIIDVMLELIMIELLVVVELIMLELLVVLDVDDVTLVEDLVDEEMLEDVWLDDGIDDPLDDVYIILLDELVWVEDTLEDENMMLVNELDDWIDEELKVDEVIVAEPDCLETLVVEEVNVADETGEALELDGVTVPDVLEVLEEVLDKIEDVTPPEDVGIWLELEGVALPSELEVKLDNALLDKVDVDEVTLPGALEVTLDNVLLDKVDVDEVTLASGLDWLDVEYGVEEETLLKDTLEELLGRPTESEVIPPIDVVPEDTLVKITLEELLGKLTGSEVALPLDVLPVLSEEDVLVDPDTPDVVVL